MFFFWERWLLEVSMANSRHLFITHFRDHRRKNEVTEVDQALSTQRRTSEPLKQGVWYSMICEMIIRMWWYVVYTCLHLFFEDSLNCYQLGSIYMYRRKFRSQLPTIWTDGKAKSEKSRRERVRRKKMEMREKVGKSRFTVFFPMICGSGGSKSRLAKAAGAEPCGQMRDEKLHAVVARSTFRSQNVQNTPTSEHLWKLRCRNIARRCGAKHISKSKFKIRHVRSTFGSCDVEKLHAGVARSTFPSQNSKYTMFGALLEVEMSKKCTSLWREARVEAKMYKAHQRRSTFGRWHVQKVHAVVAQSTSKNWRVQSSFGRSDVVTRGQRKGLCTLSKASKTWGFSSMSNNDGRRGTFEEDLERCIFHGRRSMFIRDVRRSGRGFPWEGLHFGASDFQFWEEKIVDRCSTLYNLASLFRGRRNTSETWTGKKRKTHWYEAVSPAQLSIIEGSLAELLCFWCCQLE